MCGILGTLPCDKNKNRFRKALDTLTHRGPDDSGVWSDDKSITLGHRRLSILDLSKDGHQPMHYANGRYTIIYNGEIYNFIEIKNELLKKGYNFRSTSDTEVIIAAYIEWRENCLLKFNGMWALAIWDSANKELFISRDRFGKKPFFYSIIGNRFVFASEMKAILPYLNRIEYSKRINYMFEHICDYEATDECVFEGIKRFPAGYWGLYKDGKLIKRRYWDTLEHIEEVPKSYNEQVEKFRELFIDACKIRMRSDVAIGTALSGGLDSSAVISVMSHISKNIGGERISKDWQHAFVATFPGTPLDESFYARKVVDHINIKATFKEIDPLKSWDKIEDYLYLMEDPYNTSPIPMIELYKAMRNNGVVVTIDGHGADELFSGYGHILTALSDCGYNIFKIRNVLTAQRDMTLAKGKQFPKYDHWLKSYLKQIIKNIKKGIRNPWKNLINGKKTFEQERYDYFSRMLNEEYEKKSAFNNLDELNKNLYIIFHKTILPTLLRNYDRYSMINGVEIRMPFMDHRIVSYCFSLPWTSKVRNTYNKKLIRDAVQSFMPEEVAYRKAKIGFSTPIVDWMKKELKDYFIDEINSISFQNCTIIKPKEVKKDILNVINNDNVAFSEGHQAWSNFIPYLWEKSVIKRIKNKI